MGTMTRATSAWRLLSRGLERLEEGLPAILIAAIAFGIFLNVVGRYVFGNPIVGTSELSIAALIWLVFLGSAGAARRSLHIAIDVVVNRVPPRAQAVLGVLVGLGIVAMMAVLTIWGWRLTVETQRALPLTGISARYVWVAAPIGTALIGLRTVGAIVEAAKGIRSGHYEQARGSFEDQFSLER